MKNAEVAKMLETFRKELLWREKDSARRPTREARGREEAYQYAGEMVDVILDCMRWV